MRKEEEEEVYPGILIRRRWRRRRRRRSWMTMMNERDSLVTRTRARQTPGQPAPFSCHWLGQKGR